MTQTTLNTDKIELACKTCTINASTTNVSQYECTTKCCYKSGCYWYRTCKAAEKNYQNGNIHARTL